MPQIQIDIKTISNPDLVKTFGDYTTAITGFYKAMQDGLQNLNGSLESARQAVASVQDAAEGAGAAGGKIQSAISAVSSGAATISKLKSGWDDLKSAATGVASVLPKVKGLTLIEYFTSGAAKTAGFTTSIANLAIAFGPLALHLAAIGLFVGVLIESYKQFQEVRAAEAAEKESELGVTDSLDRYNQKIHARLDLVVQEGKMSRESADAQKTRLEGLQRQYAEGKLGFEDYLKRLDEVRHSINQLLPSRLTEIGLPVPAIQPPAVDVKTLVPAESAARVRQDLQDFKNRLESIIQAAKTQPIGQTSDSQESPPASLTPAEEPERAPVADQEIQRIGTFKEEFERVIGELQKKWGGWSKQMADTFSSVFEKAVSSISSGITGLIEGTKTWAQALHQISSTILNSVISAFAEMGVRYVATKLLMSATDSLVAKKTQAENVTTLATALPTSMAQAGAQGGWVGLAAFIALFVGGLAALTALTSNARAGGGPVTAGLPYIVGERRPELFVPGQSGFIMSSVPTIMDSPSRAAAGSGASSSSLNVHFAGVLDSEELALKGLSGKRGRKFLLDFNKGSVREVTGRG